MVAMVYTGCGPERVVVMYTDNFIKSPTYLCVMTAGSCRDSFKEVIVHGFILVESSEYKDGCL